MQNATKDLLRLVFTASALVGFLLYANFEAARVVPPRGDAIARIDAPRNVMSISVDRTAARAKLAVVTPTEPSHSANYGPLVAFAQ